MRALNHPALFNCKWLKLISRKVDTFIMAGKKTPLDRWWKVRLDSLVGRGGIGSIIIIIAVYLRYNAFVTRWTLLTLPSAISVYIYERTWRRSEEKKRRKYLVRELIKCIYLIGSILTNWNSLILIQPNLLSCTAPWWRESMLIRTFWEHNNNNNNKFFIYSWLSSKYNV